MLVLYAARVHSNIYNNNNNIDHFRNDVIIRQEYYVIPDMLAKNVGRSVSISE